MAKARTVVGLDVHATKVVAAVVDVETGELSRFQMGGEAAGRLGSAPRCRVRYGSGMRPGRQGPGSVGSSRAATWSAWSPHRRRSRAGRGSGQDRPARCRASRPVVVGREAAPGQGSRARGGSAARSRPRACAGSGGSDALPASALQAAVASPDPVR